MISTNIENGKIYYFFLVHNSTIVNIENISSKGNDVTWFNKILYVLWWLMKVVACVKSKWIKSYLCCADCKSQFVQNSGNVDLNNTTISTIV